MGLGSGNPRYLASDLDSLYSDIYKEYQPQMLRVARYYLSDYLLAEDIVADAFEKLWGIRADLEQIKDIKSYLFTMVKRRCLDEIKKYSNKNRQDIEKVSPRFFIGFKNPETSYLNKELAERIIISLQNLPHRCRTVFLMVKEDKLRYKEVAQLLDISEKTVEMHVGNALKALRKDLEVYVNPPKKKTKQTFASITTFLFSLL